MRLWNRLADTIGHPEWKDHADWKTQSGRSKNRAAINAAIGEVTKHKPSEHWIELFEEAGIPCGPINTIDKVFADPQVKHLGMAQPVTHPRLGEELVVASPVNQVGLSRAIRSATAEAGQHTDEVLRSVGYSDSEISAMHAKGVV